MKTMNIEELKRILPYLNKRKIEREAGLNKKRLTYFEKGRAKLTQSELDGIETALEYITKSEFMENITLSDKTEEPDNGENITCSDLFDSVELALYRAKLPFVIEGPLFVLLGDIKYNPVTGNAGTSKEDYAHYESVHDLIEYIREERDRRQIAAFGKLEEEEEERLVDVGF